MLVEYWPADLDGASVARIRDLGRPIYSRVDGADWIEAEARRRGWVTAETAREWYWACEDSGPNSGLALARRYCTSA